MKKSLFLIGALCFPISLASALSYSTSNLPYSDAPRNLETRVALSLLTDLEVIKGNDDGTFAPNRTLNRAEFMTIVMRLRPDLAASVSTSCFPDVPSNAWYSVPVCQAKQAGIVQGENGQFSPDRPINYVEAVKVLVELYGLPVQQTEVWYQGYVDAANKADILTESIEVAVHITRAQMARITASFVAYNAGELSEFRAAQEGNMASSSSSAISISSSTSSMVTSSSSSSYTYDPYGSVTLSDSVILLGQVSPVITSVQIFSDAQPMDLTDISITLDAEAASVESLLVYDQEARYLGRATYRSGTTYTLSLRTMNIQIPKRENFTIYARAQLKGYNFGGVSGETVEVSQVLIEGTGAWNSASMSQSSSEDFPMFQTARSRITSITNAGSDRDILVAGTNLVVGQYRFAGEVADGQADVEVTDLVFQIESAGGVSISNAQLGADGTSATTNCSIVSSTVTCFNIPPSFGSVEDRTRVLTLYADVSVPATSQTQFLRLSLNQPGSIGSSGSVTWTDGSTSFVWVPFSNPVARGTYFQ